MTRLLKAHLHSELHTTMKIMSKGEDLWEQPRHGGMVHASILTAAAVCFVVLLSAQMEQQTVESPFLKSM